MNEKNLENVQIANALAAMANPEVEWAKGVPDCYRPHLREAARRLRSASTTPKKESKLLELAGNLEFIKLEYKGQMGCRWIDKAQRILRTVDKAFEPVDPTAVKPSLPDGRIHLKDIIEADTGRACDILVKCREIAEEEV